MKKRLTNLQKRHFRVRSKITGSTERPRLSVYKSSKYIYAQIIDDEKGITLVGLHSKYNDAGKMPKTESAKKLGESLAKKAIEKGITTVVFDRGGYKYHGRVKSLADAARESGLVF
ncbi:MAG: 50S ribosomal protein L18 [bacterium]